MAEAKDLLHLRKLQSQSATERLAAAEARCRALENELARALEAFDAEQIAMENNRKAHIAALIGNPSDPVTIARIGLQYEAEQDTKLARAKEIHALKDTLQSAYGTRDIARAERNESTKAERKVEELVQRLSRAHRQRQDAIMEDDR